MVSDRARIVLAETDIRVVVSFAVACAKPALDIFEVYYPEDLRPREAIKAAEVFAQGAPRSQSLRDKAWAAQRAATRARDAGEDAASHAAYAAMAAAGSAFLHPLSQAAQVKHIIGAAGHAARVRELLRPLGPADGLDDFRNVRPLASPALIDILKRYPPAPAGGGRVGALIRQLDTSLR